MQARFIQESAAPHSEDWSYGIVTSACPGGNESVAVFEADVWNPGFPEAGIDQALARQWLDQAAADGLPKSALYVHVFLNPKAVVERRHRLEEVNSYTLSRVTPAHGIKAPLTDLIDFLGYPYPNYTTADWKTGGPLCQKIEWVSSMSGSYRQERDIVNVVFFAIGTLLWDS